MSTLVLASVIGVFWGMIFAVMVVLRGYIVYLRVSVLDLNLEWY